MNECRHHHLMFDTDICPRCERQEYESRFQAECYRNAEEKHRRYITELKNTIEAQDRIIKELRDELAGADL